MPVPTAQLEGSPPLPPPLLARNHLPPRWHSAPFLLVRNRRAGPDLFIGPSRTWQKLGSNESSRQKAVGAGSDGKAVWLGAEGLVSPPRKKRTHSSWKPLRKVCPATCQALAETRRLMGARGGGESGGATAR